MHAKLILIALALPLAAIPAGANTLATPWEGIGCGDDAARAQDLVHTFVDPADPRRTVTVHITCESSAGFDSHVGTDCPSDAYALGAHRWDRQLAGYLVDPANSGLTGAQVLAATDAAGEAWDAQTAFDLYGASALGGSAANAGRFDGVNQIGWKRLSGSALAQTTTWRDTATGIVLESDTAYSTRYAWGVNGESTKMDLQSLQTHEAGRVFGLSHPPTATENQCLTMYPGGGYGATYQRTLGDGDVLGIRTVYGA